MRVMYESVVCKDGFTVSVQASSTAYCDPRKDTAERYTYFLVFVNRLSIFDFNLKLKFLIAIRSKVYGLKSLQA